MAVLIDYENVRRRGREVFGGDDAPLWFGHIDPVRLAGRLAGERELISVRVFRGEPDRRRSPAAWQAFERRRLLWVEQHVEVFSQPTRWGKEKGMDVALGTSLGIGAARGLHDVAVIVSGDNDYLTSIAMVRALNGGVEVATWRDEKAAGGTVMRVPGDIRRHSLDVSAFIALAENPSATQRFVQRINSATTTPMRQALINAGIVRAAA